MADYLTTAERMMSQWGAEAAVHHYAAQPCLDDETDRDCGTCLPCRARDLAAEIKAAATLATPSDWHDGTNPPVQR